MNEHLHPQCSKPVQLFAGNLTGTFYYPSGVALVNQARPAYLTLQRNPSNKYDNYAIKVMYGSHQVGWVPRVHSKQVSEWMEANTAHDLDVAVLVTNIDNRSISVNITGFIPKEQTMASTTTISLLSSNGIDKLIETNKTTAISAAFLEAGKLANGQVVKLAGKHLPVMLRGYADTPLGRLVIANVANIAAQKLRGNDPRLQKLTKAMMVHAYQELYAEFDLEAMLEDLLQNSSIKKALKAVDGAPE